LIAIQYSLHVAILAICVVTWLICALLFGVTALFIPRDVERLRETMQARAEAKRAQEVAAP
jgi:hypothetical protein